MDDFKFTFFWQEEEYTANVHVEGNPPRQTFFVEVDDEELQDEFGENLEFTYADEITFSWDTPDVEGAAEFMRAVNLGLMEYLDEEEDDEAE